MLTIRTRARHAIQLACELARDSWRRSCRTDAKPSGRRAPNPSRRGEHGFTLVELLVVMVILVLLASVVGPRVLGYLGTSRSKTAKVQIEALAASLELYKLDNGQYPSSADGLQALVERPSGKASWSGPYLKKRQVPLDPWGVAYNYRFPGKHGEFDIFSYGADKKEGGSGEDADVVGWQ